LQLKTLLVFNIKPFKKILKLEKREMNKILLTLTTLILFSSSLYADQENIVKHYNSGKTLSGDLPFSEMVQVGNTLYLSGQLGAIPGTMKLVPGGMKEEARQTMENIKITLESHGFSMKNIVKCTVMLADISEWAAFNKIYVSYFEKPYPARAAFGANGLGFGARLEVDCIAAIQ